MTISPIDISHADELAELAKSIYKEYYLHLWHPGGADWYMYEYAYANEKLKSELADPNNLHFVIYENGQPMGYLKIKLDAAWEGLDPQKSLEIERIYLHKAIGGKGIGKKLMLLSEEVAMERKKETIFLKAMDTSKDAIRFYQNMGYSICGTLTLPFPQMKEEYRGMVVLKKRFEQMNIEQETDK